jgi:RimJ/RimL family protein N-acetyltransferase
MEHPLWPPFDVTVHTPLLSLVPVTDEVAVELARVAADGVHDPSTMPFLVPWTDLPRPDLERGVLRFHWRARAEMTPDAWRLAFGVVVDDAVVGSIDLAAERFPSHRRFETGSWLGRRFQGRGLGREMRLAALTLGFDGLGAARATTGAYHDNAASLGVTRSLGYTETGRRRRPRRHADDTVIEFEMGRAAFARVRRADITLIGVDPLRSFLSLP